MLQTEPRLWTPRRRGAPLVERARSMPREKAECIGFSHGMGGRSGTPSIPTYVQDPATLPMMGWWRGNSTTGYAVSISGTFLGVASAGSSGSSRDLTSSGNPPATDTTLNTHVVPNFDGGNDALSLAVVSLGSFVSTSAWFFWALVYVDAIDTDSATVTSNDIVFSDTNANWGIHLRGGGSPLVYAYQSDGAEKKAQASFATGLWQLICARYDGTNIRLRVNGGKVQTAPAGSIANVAGTMRMGGAGSAFLDGRVADVGIANFAGSDLLFGGIRGYVQARYLVTV